MPANQIDSLRLDGWDHQSIWGYDEGTELYFAQLWRNTEDDSASPTFWLGFRPPAEWACQIWDAIVAATGADPQQVRRAMGDDPNIDIRPSHLFPASWERAALEALLFASLDPTTRCADPTPN